MATVRNPFQSDEGVVSTELMNATGALGLPAGTKMFLVGTQTPEKNEVTFDRIEARDLDGNLVADPKDPSKPFVLQTTPIVATATKLQEDPQLKMEFDNTTAVQRVVDEGVVRMQAKKAEEERLAAEAKKAAEEAAAKGGDGRHEQNVDSSAGAAQGEGEGNFLTNNMFGLGGGLLVGLLAAAMGGGIVGLIVGLLAMMMIGAMMDKNGMANNMLGRNKEEKGEGKGRSREQDVAPGKDQEVKPEVDPHANAIDVKEGKDVPLIKMEGTKKTYLSGQNKENGEYIYSDTPQEITLRTVNKDGVATGLIKGKVDSIGENFDISASASVLPDGRMGPMAEGRGYVQLDSTGNLDLNMPASNRGRKAGADAAAAYAKPQDIALETTPEGKATAAIGTIQVEGKDYTAVLSGAMGADGKTAVFDKALLKDADGKLVSGTNGNPIEVALPNQQLQELAVTDGKVSPMTGDVDKAKPEIAGQILGEQKKQLDAQERSRQGKADEIIEGVKQTSDKEHTRQVLHEHVSDRLQELGVTNPSERAIMSSNITNQYMDANFRTVPKEKAAETIAGMVGKDETRQTEMGDLIGRIHESVSSTISSKAGDNAAVDPGRTGQLQPDAITPAVPPQETGVIR